MLQRLLQALHEQDGLANIPPPVTRIEDVAIERLAGDGGEEDLLALLRDDSVEIGEKRGFDRVHHLAVKWIR